MIRPALSRSWIRAAIVLCACWLPRAEAQIVYVDDDGPPTGDGSSWANAYPDLTQALVHFDGGGVEEVWVAQGVYRPNDPLEPTDPRSASWRLRVAFVLRGGYAGDPTQPELRDPELYPSILSGDIGTPGDASDNCRRVVVANSAVDERTVLDGFVVEGGYADRNVDRGAGLFLQGHPTIQNCTIRSNFAWYRGGGMEVRGPSRVLNCRIENNSTDGPGGGVYSSGSAVFEDCLFRENTAVSGGRGIWTEGSKFVRCRFEDHAGSAVRVDENSSTPARFFDCRFEHNIGPSAALTVTRGNLQLVGCVFFENGMQGTGTGKGAAVAYLTSGDLTVVGCRFVLNGVSGRGGGIYWEHGAPVIVNSEFIGNYATEHGGALFSTSAQPVIANCTFFGNHAFGLGGGLRYSSSPQVRNCIFWGNSDSLGAGEGSQISAAGAEVPLERCCVQGWTGALPGAGSFGADPHFVDPAGPDGSVGSEDDDFTLALDSPCLDRGSNALVPLDVLDLDLDGDLAEPIPLDVLGAPRFQDAPAFPEAASVGLGAPVDLGARERAGCGAVDFCSTSPNSVGAGARIDSAGTTSVAANQLVLLATACPPEETGFFFYGTEATQAPFEGGFLCVGGSTFMLRAIPTLHGDVAHVFDNTSPMDPGGAVHAGSTWYFQFWYTDLDDPHGAGSNLTDALAITFCP